MSLYRMLIAEDEPVARKGIHELIPWYDYGIEIVGEAEDGKSALDLTRRLSPDLALVDIRMPFIDGLEYCRLAQDEGIRPPVVIISAYDQFEYAQRAIRQGVEDFVIKPIDDEELIAAVGRALNADATDSAMRRTLEKVFWFKGPSGAEPQDSLFRVAVLDYIRSSYTENVSLDPLADRLAISRTHLAHKVRAEFGVSLSHLFLQYRCEIARDLLRNPRLRVNEVAEQVGYQDLKTFTNTFKRHIGSTPSEFRKNG